MTDLFPEANLLNSPCAAVRLEGIVRVASMHRYEAVDHLKALLSDDAPFAFQRGPKTLIGEVRFDALHALERLYLDARRTPDFGPVTVRRAMLAQDALEAADQHLKAMTASERQRLTAAAAADVDARVQPTASREAVLAYRTLQLAKAIAYDVQTVDPVSALTPLQVEVASSQLQRPRPRPNLQVFSSEDASRTLDFVYRDKGRWVLDFSEEPDSRGAMRRIRSIMTIERGGVPNVVHDDVGQPRRDPDSALVLDGIIPRDTGQPIPYLRSIAAFLAWANPSTINL